MFFKGPKTNDESYVSAKNKLKNYQLASQNIEKSIQRFGQQLHAISKSYLKFASTAFGWWGDIPPAVSQVNQSVLKGASEFERATTELCGQIKPNFDAQLTEYDEKIKSLLAIEKKRNTACVNFEKAQDRLKAAQGAKEPIQERIDQAQQQADELQKQYEEANNEFVNAVNDFGEERKVKLLETFKILCGIMCQYINRAMTIQALSFPADLNAGLQAELQPVEQVKIEYAPKKEKPKVHTEADEDNDDYLSTPANTVPTTSSMNHASSSPFGSNENLYGASQSTTTSYSAAPVTTTSYEPIHQEPPKQTFGFDTTYLSYQEPEKKPPAQSQSSGFGGGGQNPFDGDDDDDDNYDGQNPFG